MPTPVEEGMRPIAFSMAMLRTQQLAVAARQPIELQPDRELPSQPDGAAYTGNGRSRGASLARSPCLPNGQFP
jgi:hypothetical protein